MNKQDNYINYWGYSTLNLVHPTKVITTIVQIYNIIVLYCITVTVNDNLDHKINNHSIKIINVISIRGWLKLKRSFLNCDTKYSSFRAFSANYSRSFSTADYRILLMLGEIYHRVGRL